MINYPPDLPPHSKGCFGQLWDASALECKGGLNPALRASDGTNVHPKCPVFAKCAAETVRNNLNQKKAAQPYQSVPIAPPIHSIMRGAVQGARTALVKHVSQPASPVVQPPQFYPQVAQQQAYYGQPTPMMVHPLQAAVPHMVPMNYQSPGTQMPGYLTNPEPVVEGQHWASRLFFNIVRSMAKAGCHTTANFVDHTTVNHPVMPPTEPQGGQG